GTGPAGPAGPAIAEKSDGIAAVAAKTGEAVVNCPTGSAGAAVAVHEPAGPAVPAVLAGRAGSAGAAVAPQRPAVLAVGAGSRGTVGSVADQRAPQHILEGCIHLVEQILQRIGVGGLGIGVGGRTGIQTLDKLRVKCRRLSTDRVIGLRVLAEHRRDAHRHLI